MVLSMFTKSIFSIDYLYPIFIELVLHQKAHFCSLFEFLCLIMYNFVLVGKFSTFCSATIVNKIQNMYFLSILLQKKQ